MSDSLAMNFLAQSKKTSSSDAAPEVNVEEFCRRDG
jgi:hypothetical protein